jgi:hypothetical protein
MTTITPLNLVEVNTDSYRLSHGAAPSGYGRYAFQIGDKTETITDSYLHAIGTAKRLAGLKGLSEVKLLP